MEVQHLEARLDVRKSCSLGKWSMGQSLRVNCDDPLVGCLEEMQAGKRGSSALRINWATILQSEERGRGGLSPSRRCEAYITSSSFISGRRISDPLRSTQSTVTLVQIGGRVVGFSRRHSVSSIAQNVRSPCPSPTPRWR